MSAPSPLIEMAGVTVASLADAAVVVAAEVAWTVQAGDYWVVAGLQGSGKSDFLMLTAGLMAPAQGQYRLFGEEMPIFEENRLETRLRLGLVFDGAHLFNHLTVRENIALPLRYHRNLSPAEAEPEVERMLEAMELGPWADSTPGALGRNWQKRAGLARALMLKPELLLLDNPLGGLDPRHANWWLGCLGQLAAGQGVASGRPMTLVVTAADLRPWKGRARQFALLRQQRLTVLGGYAAVERGETAGVRELLAGAEG